MILDPKTAALLGGAQGLLSASGYNRVPVTMGQALSSGLGGATDFYNMAIQSKMRREQEDRLERQEGRLQRQFDQSMKAADFDLKQRQAKAQAQQKAGGLLAGGDTKGAAGVLAPHDQALMRGMISPPQPKGKVGEYLNAVQSGVVPPETTYEDFQKMGKGPLVKIDMEKNEPIPIKDISKIVDTTTGKPPSYGLTPNDVKENPGRYIVKEKEVSGETAGKMGMLQVAQKQMPLIQKLMFDKDGSPNYLNIAAMAANTPKTEGRKLRTAMEVGIQGITRVETGAAMPPQEVQNTRKRFQPSIFDGPDTIALKWSMYQDFLNGALKLLDPNRRFTEQREEFYQKLDNEMERRSQSKPIEDMTDEELMEIVNN